MKVLLIDDSSTSRGFQRKALTPLGVSHFDEAENGLQALEILRKAEYQYNLVLLDINMPEMSGLEVLKEVRSENKSIPVVMCTSLSQKSKVLEAMKFGATNYLTKPYESEELQRKVAEYLNN